RVHGDAEVVGEDAEGPPLVVGDDVRVRAPGRVERAGRDRADAGHPAHRMPLAARPEDEAAVEVVEAARAGPAVERGVLAGVADRAGALQREGAVELQ